MIRMRNRLFFRPSLRPMTQLPPGFKSFSSRKARRPSASSFFWRARTHSLSGVPWDRKRSYLFDGSPTPDIAPPWQRHLCPTRFRCPCAKAVRSEEAALDLVFLGLIRRASGFC